MPVVFCCSKVLRPGRVQCTDDLSQNALKTNCVDCSVTSSFVGFYSDHSKNCLECADRIVSDVSFATIDSVSYFSGKYL